MVEKNKSKLNKGVLVFTIVLLIGVVGYFAFFNKDDIPEAYELKSKVYVTAVELDKKELTINVGESSKLNALITPLDATNKNVTWISNNDSVVKVDPKGNINGLSVGKGTITVRTEDGKKTASCVVRVIESNSKDDDNYVDVIGVSLNTNNISLLKGKSYKLVATVKPDNATNKNITWTSSDDSIVEVDEKGNVKAKQVGKVRITAKTKDGGKMAICYVTVMDKSIPVTGVMLNKLKLTLVKGESETIGMTLSPSNATNNSVTWSSSNTNVAKVDSNGKVTAVGIGTATIMVKTKDGNKTAKCTVTVENLKIDVTDITLNQTELELTVGSSKKLNATITPSNATNKLIDWKSSNEKVAKVDSDGKVTAVGVGKAMITAQTVEGNKSAKCEITVTR